MELSWWLCVSRTLTEEELWAGEPWRRGNSLLKMAVARELGQHGNGCPPSVEKQARESLGCEQERMALQGWEGFKLLLVTLLETVQDSVPPSEGLMLEVLCRGEFSTPHDIKFFVLSRAVPHSSTSKGSTALWVQQRWRDECLNFCEPFPGLSVGPHILCCPFSQQFLDGKCGCEHQRLTWGEGQVLAQQVLLAAQFTPQ